MRLDGARGKKQVWRPHVRNRSFGRKCTVLKKVLVTLLGLFGARGIIPTCPPSLRPCLGLPQIYQSLLSETGFEAREFARL